MVRPFMRVWPISAARQGLPGDKDPTLSLGLSRKPSQRSSVSAGLLAGEGGSCSHRPNPSSFQLSRKHREGFLPHGGQG